MMSQPLLPWDSETEDHPDLVWRATMDDRYLIEVGRTDESTAKLRIFDHYQGRRGDRLLGRGAGLRRHLRPRRRRRGRVAGEGRAVHRRGLRQADPGPLTDR